MKAGSRLGANTSSLTIESPVLMCLRAGSLLAYSLKTPQGPRRSLKCGRAEGKNDSPRRHKRLKFRRAQPQVSFLGHFYVFLKIDDDICIHPLWGHAFVVCTALNFIS